MKIDELNSSHIIAEDGKILKRKSDGLEVGEELYLGYTYYLNGEKLAIPYKEKQDDYEEVDDETILLDEEELTEVIVEETIEEVNTEEITEEIIEEPINTPRTVTVADVIALEKEVAELKEIINKIIN